VKQALVVYSARGSRPEQSDGFQQVAFPAAIGPNKYIDLAKFDLNVEQRLEAFDGNHAYHFNNLQENSRIISG